MVLQRAWVTPLGALWTVKADARQVITAYGTRAEATAAARSLLASTGGGELIVRAGAGYVLVRESVARHLP